MKSITNTNITRKEICTKYNVPFETFRGWLRYDHSYSYGKKVIERRSAGTSAVLNSSNYKDMSREELQLALIKKDIEIAKLKKVPMASRYGRHGIRWSKQIDYTIILELNSQYPIKTLCEIMNVKRDGFYKWINRIHYQQGYPPQVSRDKHVLIAQKKKLLLQLQYNLFII